jgi:peptidoglycan/xylan/chitin deacetylase (PgdA/CDA1 family)
MNIRTPTFPNGAHCAVSLTYDDGIASHFEDVGPTLEANGLRGTFNITIARDSVLNCLPEWRAMATRGHELGNHSLFHPCRSTPEDPKPWVGPYNLVDYTERRLREELDVANGFLTLIDGKTERTYSNTCWHDTFGSGAEARSMQPILAGTFLAARGRLTHTPVNLAHIDFWGLGSAAGDRRTFADLSAEVEALTKRGGWIIYTFHGVGEGTHNHFIHHPEHRQFIEWLGQSQAQIWTAPMIEVVRTLK